MKYKTRAFTCCCGFAGLSEFGVGFGLFFDTAQQWGTLAGVLTILAAYPYVMSLSFESPYGLLVLCGKAHTVCACL